MKFTGYILSIIFFLAFTNYAQDTLYNSDKFIFTGDAVFEDDFTARAVSDRRIISNFISGETLGNQLRFKFSINGFDNELPQNLNHVFKYNFNKKHDSTEVIVFGIPDSLQQDVNNNFPGLYDQLEFDLLIRLDFRNVLKSFEERGSYKIFSGVTISKDEFNGIYVAGDTKPLTWNFGEIQKNPDYELKDPDGDGIYEIKIRFQNPPDYNLDSKGNKVWNLKRDISGYPEFNSPYPILNATYNLSLEELLLNIRDDSTYMAGEKWTGVWTRDISYSTILSLAIIDPLTCIKSLKAKVKNGMIIQDTGTGGSWPVSTDRIVWALAAWEVYIFYGDIEWLEYAYDIIRNTLRADEYTIFDQHTGLVFGESSFLDWREQSYPAWMEPVDIFSSRCLSTNILHYAANQIAYEMSAALGKPDREYLTASDSIRDALNKYLWIPSAGFYGQYLYGDPFPYLSGRSETLGEALSIIYNVADDERSCQILRSVPVSPYGISCFSPQINNIPPYHNDAIWPFVGAYWAWAASLMGNEEAVLHAFASIQRGASLFLSNKENIVASTGNYLGTEINSDRQLWSVAGNLALTYRILFGISADEDSLYINPFIPGNLKGKYELKNLRYRNSSINILVEGGGSVIDEIYYDGKITDRNSISSSLKGKHTLRITLKTIHNEVSVNYKNITFAPITPLVRNDSNILNWNKITGAESYNIFINGELLFNTVDTTYIVESTNCYQEIQVQAQTSNGLKSFLSRPVLIEPPDKIQTIQFPDESYNIENHYIGFSGPGYIRLERDYNKNVEVLFDVPESGEYLLQFRYANGSGPINTSNKAALRTLEINDVKAGIILMPQRGEQEWSNWGYSNKIKIYLNKGINKANIIYDEYNENMNVDINSALLDHIRLIKLSCQ